MNLNTSRKLLATLLLAGASLAVSAEQTPVLFVQTKSAGQVAYALSEKPAVTFTEAEVVLTTSKVTASYPLSEQVTMTFGEIDMDAVIAPTSDLSAVIACDGKAVKVMAAKPGERMSLYDIDGRLLKTTTVDAQGGAVLTLDAPSTYIVKVGKLAVKVRN